MSLVKRKGTVATVLLAAIVLISSCSQPFDFRDSQAENDRGSSDDHKPMPIVVSSIRFSLAWEPVFGDAVSYRVSYRVQGTDTWRYLADVPASDNPSLEVSDDILEYGTYEFAVRTVASSGEISGYHTSLDSTADPGSGWYLSWTGP